MSSSSYDLFVTNNYSQKILCCNKNFWAPWWHGTQHLSYCGLCDCLALLRNVQCTSSVGFQALKFHKIMRSYKSVAYFGRHWYMKSYKYHFIMQKDKKRCCALIQATFMKMETMTISITRLCTLLRKCPLPHIKPNTDYYCPASACWPVFRLFLHSSHFRHSGCYS
jgi:hypothetical protein